MKNILNGMLFGFGIIIMIGITYFVVMARTSTNPGTVDGEPDNLYVDSSQTLTAAKRNTMVDNIFTKKIHKIDCFEGATSASNVQKIITWTSALCGGVSKLPNQYDNCISGIRFTHSNSAVTRFTCEINQGSLFPGTSDYRLGCTYLCWDN